jgi:hypothetical protein
MEVACKKCNKVYRIDSSKIPEKVKSFQCRNCKNSVPIPITGGEPSAVNIEERLNPADKKNLTAARLFEKTKDHSMVLKRGVDQISSAFQNKLAGSEGKKTEENLPVEINGLDEDTSLSKNGLSKKKIVMTAIILVLLLIIQIRPLRNVFFENFLFQTADRAAEEYIDSSFQRAMVAFATARGINAVISVLQESNVQVQPAGIGVTIAVGEVLDPVNDIVERFSWIMLISLLSLGIQKAMVVIGPWLSISVLLNISLVCMLAPLWLENSFSQSLKTIAKKALLAALVLKFAMPCVAFLNHRVYSAVLENQYETASGIINQEADSLKSMEPGEEYSNYAVEDSNAGWWDKTKMAIGKAKDSMKNVAAIKQKIAHLKNRAGEITENFVRLSIVFILNTVFIPILFLWGLVSFGRLLVGINFGARFEENITSKIVGHKSVNQSGDRLMSRYTGSGAEAASTI